MMQCQTSGCHGLSGAIHTGGGQWIQFCPICKTKQAIQPPRQPDEADGLAVRALVDLQRANYAAAEKGFLDAAAKTAQDASRQAFYLWCSLIARYGVEYVQEVQFESIPARRSCLFVPTFGRFPLPDHRIMETEACRQLDMLLFGMPGVDVGSHLRELDILIQEIEDCCRDRKNQYNVFIAWHDRADDGHGPCRTFADRLNSYLNAQRDCYSFVSFRSLHDVIVDHYEPHIYTALASARVMVIVVDDLDAMQRKFLRSEINRFLIRRAANHKLHIYLCCMQGATGTPPTMMAGWQRRNGCENTEVWYELVTKDVMERLRDDTPAPKPEPVPQPEPPKPEPVPQPVPKPEPEPAPEAEQKKQKKIDWKSVLSTAYKVLKPIISNFFVKTNDVTGKKGPTKRGLLSSITAVLLCISQVVSGVVMPDGAESGQGFSALIGWVKQGWVSVFGEKGEGEEKDNGTDDIIEPVDTATQITNAPTKNVVDTPDTTPLPTTFTYGDFDISYEEDGLVITEYAGDETTVEIPTQINGVPVVAIGDEAFSYCYNLTNITIPDSITSIGDKAFYYCDNLTSITIPDGAEFIGSYAFSYCESLTNIVIPGSVSSISDYAFSHCFSIDSIIIQYGVTSIGNYAFYGCRNLTSIALPTSITSIGTSSFNSCGSLSSITIPDGVTSIANKTFAFCSSLASITIPGSVTSIGDWAFNDCDSITSIVIPDSVTSIGSNAFSGCSILTSITISDSVTSIGGRAFFDCPNLILAVTPGSYAETYAKENSIPFVDVASTEPTEKATATALPTTFTYGDFNVSHEEDGLVITKYRGYEENVEIPSQINGLPVVAIGDRAFYRSFITNITIPDSVTSIGDGAFLGCFYLTSISFPDSITSIGDSSFSACASLTSISLPDSITSIGTSAFAVSENLTSITIPKSATFIGDGAFAYLDPHIEITVAPGNSVFTVQDGVLIDTHQKKLLWYQKKNDAFSYQIPKGISSIGDYVFSFHDNLINITIPNNISSIGKSAFSNCGNLTGITIPDSVTFIGERAFSDCPNLTLTVTPGSYAETYAKENNIPYQYP